MVKVEVMVTPVTNKPYFPVVYELKGAYKICVAAFTIFSILERTLRAKNPILSTRDYRQVRNSLYDGMVGFTHFFLVATLVSGIYLTCFLSRLYDPQT